MPIPCRGVTYCRTSPSASSPSHGDGVILLRVRLALRASRTRKLFPPLPWRERGRE